jgi:hypothetical protein
MYWSYPRTDLEHNLSVFLNRRLAYCSNKPAGPESARLHSVKDFIAELEHGGIQLEGFTTTRSEERSGSSRQPSVHPIYTITCNALPASECFVCIDPGSGGSGSTPQFYARVYEAMTYYGESVYDKNFTFVYRFLEQIEEIAAELPLVRAKFEKQQKIIELTQDSIDTWFSQICEELGYPYSVDKRKIHTKLYVKLDEKTRLEIVVQHKNFQEVMPELRGLIQAYNTLREGSKARVLISNYSRGSWREPGKKHTEKDEDEVEEWDE